MPRGWHTFSPNAIRPPRPVPLAHGPAVPCAQRSTPALGGCPNEGKGGRQHPTTRTMCYWGHRGGRDGSHFAVGTSALGGGGGTELHIHMRSPGPCAGEGTTRPSTSTFASLLPSQMRLSAGPTPLGSALSPLRMACQTKGHGRNSHAYPGGRGVQTLEHTDTAETRVQVGLGAIGRLIGRSASRSGLNTASVRVNTRGGSTASGRFRDLRVCLLRVGQGVYCLCVFSQRSRRYGALFGHSASQAGLASTHGSPNTAVPALRCPSWAFGEPSWTCYTPLTTHHSSPGVTVSILGIRRAKLDVLHATDHPSQQSRRYGVHLGHSASQAGRATRH